MKKIFNIALLALLFCAFLFADTNDRNTIIEESTMPARIDKIYSEIFSNFGFKSVKDFPKNKNVIRLCSTSDSYDIIELTWTKSSASITFVEEATDRKKQNKKIKRKVDEKEVDKIINLLGETDFYNQPSYIRYTDRSSRDGCEWYIETNIGGSYKSIIRDLPNPKFGSLGYALYDLANGKTIGTHTYSEFVWE